MAAKPETPGQISSVDNEKGKTLEEVLAEMNGIHDEAKKIWKEKNLTQANTKELDAIFEDQRVRHKELYSSYPTVLRHMLQEMQYSPKAFEKYLRRLTVAPWMNDSERMDRYADYFLLLYKAINPKFNPVVANTLRADYRNRLQSEHDLFKTRYETARRQVEASEKKTDEERKRYILEIARMLAAMDAKPAETSSTPDKTATRVSGPFDQE